MKTMQLDHNTVRPNESSWYSVLFFRRWRWLVLLVAILSWVADLRADEDAERPSESVRIVLFVPSDLTAPEGARQRITKIADAADAFLLDGMRRLGYPPGVKSLFRRDADGQVELLLVRGEDTAASGKYADPNCLGYVINKAGRENSVPQTSNVWWVFMYLGDRPMRYNPWAGSGNPRDGGWAIINYDTVPGEIRPDLQLTEGFNLEYKLKSSIHELGHGFGLTHMGPDPTLGLGNSLMGPNPPEYASRRGPKADCVYLAASEAAMLWKHPFFTGKAMKPFEPWEMNLADYRAAYDAAADTVTITGKLVSKQSAHSVVLIDDRGERRELGEYWSRSYAVRLAPDGSFQIKVSQPAKIDGLYRILFCFENGIVTGNGKDIGPATRGDIHKTYRFREGRFEFPDE